MMFTSNKGTDNDVDFGMKSSAEKSGKVHAQRRVQTNPDCLWRQRYV